MYNSSSTLFCTDLADDKKEWSQLRDKELSREIF